MSSPSSDYKQLPLMCLLMEGQAPGSWPLRGTSQLPKLAQPMVLSTLLPHPSPLVWWICTVPRGLIRLVTCPGPSQAISSFTPAVCGPGRPLWPLILTQISLSFLVPSLAQLWELYPEIPGIGGIRGKAVMTGSPANF